MQINLNLEINCVVNPTRKKYKNEKKIKTKIVSKTKLTDNKEETLQ